MMDAGEFKRLYLPFQPKLYRVAYAILRDNQEAEDIVQEVYLKLWNRRNDLPLARCSEAYCVTMTRNMCRDMLRAKSGVCQVEIDGVRQWEGAEVFPEWMAKEECEESSRKMAFLTSLIQQLPEIQRKVLEMRDVEQYSLEEIQVRTGLLPVNIRATLSKARKKLREQFNRRMKDEN